MLRASKDKGKQTAPLMGREGVNLNLRRRYHDTVCCSGEAANQAFGLFN